MTERKILGFLIPWGELNSVQIFFREDSDDDLSGCVECDTNRDGYSDLDCDSVTDSDMVRDPHSQKRS
jgi:hypothetical protein